MTGSPRTTIADQALLAAVRGWADDADERLWTSFAPVWRATLSAGSDDAPPPGREPAQAQLRREHAAQVRPDLSRIHPSWLIRALKDESPAVQRTVTATAPKAIGETLRSGLGLTDDQIRTDRPPAPEAIGLATVLWTERLVGDVSERDDAPVIVALTRYDLREVSRLIALIALAKCAGSPLSTPDVSERDLARLEHFRTVLASRNAGFTDQAARDVAAYGKAGQHSEASVGLLTLARLLDVEEPFRVRWALQHLPYALAKSVRTLMRPRQRHDPALLPWESAILAAATDRLRDEARFSDAAGDAT